MTSTINFRRVAQSIERLSLALAKIGLTFQQLLSQDAIAKVDRILIERYGESFPRSMIENFIEFIPNFRAEYLGNIALTQEQAAIDLVEMGGVRIFGCFIRPNEKGERSLRLAKNLLRQNAAGGINWNESNLPTPESIRREFGIDRGEGLSVTLYGSWAIGRDGPQLTGLRDRIND